MNVRMNVLDAALLLCRRQQWLDQRQNLQTHVGQQNFSRTVHAIGQRCFQTGNMPTQFANLLG
jgi:hypothetical protein